MGHSPATEVTHLIIHVFWNLVLVLSKWILVLLDCTLLPQIETSHPIHTLFSIIATKYPNTIYGQSTCNYC